MNAVEAIKARIGKPVLLNLRPARDRRHDARGWCAVCGRRSTFVFNSWVIPRDLHEAWGDQRVSSAYTRRESMFCRACCASLRVRRMAEVVVELYSPVRRPFRDLVADEEFRRLDVAEINTIGSLGSLHAFLSRLPRLAFSEYHGPDRLGVVIEGARNEDICRLSYPDASFDLVLSSDTLEHVSDFHAALSETRRVLRPGGRHVFTIPIVATRAVTVARARRQEGGEVVNLMPPIYHGRGAGPYRFVPVGRDLLTFTEFGRDIVEHLRTAGFEAEVFPDPADAVGALTVFSGRAPG